jgi:single-strand DNA-binding protein
MKTNVNKVEITGYLGTNPSIFSAANGNKITRLRIATSTSYKNLNGDWVENTTWHNVILWNRQAESAFNELRKGMLVNLQGRIVYNQYNDKDGHTRYAAEIVAHIYNVGNIVSAVSA